LQIYLEPRNLKFETRNSSTILSRAYFLRSAIRSTPLHYHSVIHSTRLTHIRRGFTNIMALNAASHNPTGTPTGPVSGAPPPLGDDTKDAILKASSEQEAGQSAPGQEHPKDPEKKEKSAKEIAREKAKAEKLKKFEEKKAAQKAKSQNAPTAPAKAKPVKAKEEEAPVEYTEETPKGQKKILKSLDDPERKAYVPKVVESAWLDWWEKEGFFKPDFSKLDNGTFVIPIPPPNVTGALHIGHALANSLQDCLIRWNRMVREVPDTKLVVGLDCSTRFFCYNILLRLLKSSKLVLYANFQTSLGFIPASLHVLTFVPLSLARENNFVPPGLRSCWHIYSECRREHIVAPRKEDTTRSGPRKDG
jgi:hypothetical protein